MTWTEDVVNFHRVTDTPVLDTPAWPSDDRISLREGLVVEEVLKELLPAIARRDLIETADAIIDSIYVLIGMGKELGLPMTALWNAVQQSNMAKAVLQPDGSFKVNHRLDGKILKPEGWTPPDIAQVLRQHGWKG